MVHYHTSYSDGKRSVLKMALAAEALGMKYITMADHSPSAHYAGGVSLDALKAQWDEISAAQEQTSIRILRGTESDILRDGSLDYPDARSRTDGNVPRLATFNLRNRSRSPQRAPGLR